MGLRQDKFARQIQKDLSELISLNRNEWVSSAFVTVSTVQVSPDMGHLKVYLTLYNNQNRIQLLQHINSISKDIRHALAIRIKNNVRKIPEIRFYEDDTLDYVEKMDKLFEKISKKED